MMSRYFLTSSPRVGQRLTVLADQLSQSPSYSQGIHPFSSSAHGSHSQNVEVLFEPHGHAEVVTLNKPASLNALNMTMIRLMYPAYRSFLKDHAHGHSGKTIILKGTGGKAFCAGGDVVALYQQHKNGESVEKVCQFFKEEYKLNYTISLLPAHVAILNGITMGGGVGVSILGKYRVATDNTLFAMPETSE
jgi:enoyl-CoA hydratase/carnithine racemase